MKKSFVIWSEIICYLDLKLSMALSNFIINKKIKIKIKGGKLQSKLCGLINELRKSSCTQPTHEFPGRQTHPLLRVLIQSQLLRGNPMKMKGVCANSHEGRQYKARERRDPLTWRGIILKSRRSGNQYSTATFGYSWRVIFKPVMCGWKDGGSTRSCPTKMTFPFVLLVNKWVSLHNTPLFFPIITSMPLHYYNFTSRAFACFKII